MLLSTASAQPRAIITPQEAQTPPYIDPQQLSKPQFLEKNAVTVTDQRIQALQELALSPPSNRSEVRQQQAEALWQLGLLHLHGLQVSLDPPLAENLFERAQALGHPLASAGLAWCAIDGCGTRPRPQKASSWIQSLRKQAPGRSAYLEWLMLSTLSPIHSTTSTAPATNRNLQNRQQAALQKAVQLGDAQARVEWGLQLAETGKKGQALQQFRAAAQSSKAASHNIQVLNSQAPVRANGNQGQQGAAWQTFRQARVYHRGEGVPANYTEAIRLYQRASDMGSPQAKRMLALIYSRPHTNGTLDIAWMQQLAFADVSEDTKTIVHMPNATSSLQRDATPLYDYLNPRWRK